MCQFNMHANLTVRQDIAHYLENPGQALNSARCDVPTRTKLTNFIKLIEFNILLSIIVILSPLHARK